MGIKFNDIEKAKEFFKKNGFNEKQFIEKINTFFNRINKMSCNCKNPDGTLSEICIGTCSQKSIEDRIEYILGIFLNKVEEQIVLLKNMSMEKYKEGYKDGFADGREFADY